MLLGIFLCFDCLSFSNNVQVTVWVVSRLFICSASFPFQKCWAWMNDKDQVEYPQAHNKNAGPDDYWTIVRYSQNINYINYQLSYYFFQLLLLLFVQPKQTIRSNAFLYLVQFQVVYICFLKHFSTFIVSSATREERPQRSAVSKSKQC